MEDYEARVLARLAQFGLESFYPVLKAKGYGDSRMYPVKFSGIFLDVAAVGREVGMNEDQLIDFVHKVADVFAKQNRDRECAQWDPMMAGVLHGIGQLAYWRLFEKWGLTFELITRLSELRALDSVPAHYWRHKRFYQTLKATIKQARDLALRVRALLDPSLG
jgi:hypothetical protein